MNTYKPSKASMWLNTVFREWVIYPLLKRDNEKHATFNFCQFMRWNVYAVFKIIAGYFLIWATFAMLLMNGTLLWESFQVGHFVNLGESIYAGAILKTMSFGSVSILIPMALWYLVSTAIVSFILAACVVSLALGLVVEGIKHLQKKTPSLSINTSFYDSLKDRHKLKICPQVKYGDEHE